jgi:ketosteroid isomerase-like protein
MLTEREAREFAHRWIRAWNSHDLDAIMSHYELDVVLVSPAAVEILESPPELSKGMKPCARNFGGSSKYILTSRSSSWISCAGSPA